MEAKGSLGFEVAKGRRIVGVGGSRRAGELKRRCGREPKCRWGLIGDDDQASVTTASFSDDGEQMR